MDQFSAHLDRGWDLVQRGIRVAQNCLPVGRWNSTHNPPKPTICLDTWRRLQGEFEDAIESYKEAIALDDTYLEAMLNAAEVYIHPLGDFDEALRICDHALSLAENDDELVDTLLLKFDAHLGKGELDDAKALCGRFPAGPFENPNHTFLVGRALYETGDVERAAPLIEEAVKRSGKNPEATYYLGLVRDERGDARGATEAFLNARELDLELPARSGP
jgi:tetratricopeptide (TPR) repeat protein